VTDIRSLLKDPYTWGTCVVMAVSLMVVGWAGTYPVGYSPVEVPILHSISPLFWVGLCLGFAGLGGLVLTSRSRYVHWLASCLFVLLLTAPQFLYLSWGSDFGALSIFVRYTQAVGTLDFQRDVAVGSYFQWPVSILFHSFLVDALGVGSHTAVHIGFVFVILCVGGGLYALWFYGLPEGESSSRAVFWGIVVYFAGFYWMLNWQAVPYAFSMALFLPMLALLDKRTLSHKIALLLLFAVGIETHALFGIWSILIVGLLVALGILERRMTLTLSLAMLMAVAQISLIIYKNIRFFRYIMFNLQGYSRAFLEIAGSDKVLARQAKGALSPLSSDVTGAVLKVLSWSDLAFVGIAFVIATLVVIQNRRLRNREVALLGTGALHFAAGTMFVAIGARSIQLIAMVPALFVADGIAHGGRIARRAILIASVMGLLLFPAAIIRSHQISGYFLRPSFLLAKEYMARHRDDLLDTVVILSEGAIYSTDRLGRLAHNPRTVQVSACQGVYAVVDTPQFRRYMGSAAGLSTEEIGTRLDQLDLSAFYGSGSVTIWVGRDCSELSKLWK
jgi:hypothetical protein